MSTKEQRKRFKEYHEEHAKIHQAWIEAGMPNPTPSYPKCPGDLVGLACGAITKRAGTPCKLTSIYSNGRCKFHGGLSTGPKTVEGKKTASLNGRRPKTKRIL